MRGLGNRALDELDVLIAEHRLHAHGGSEPVNLWPLLEAHWAGYFDLSDEIEAVAVRWRRQGVQYARIGLNHGLREVEASARKRHAEGHEYGHLALRHRGPVFTFRNSDCGLRSETDGFALYVEGVQERECELVAAYLLVPLSALLEHRGCEAGYIGRVLDVPGHLVELRWAIWRRYGR